MAHTSLASLFSDIADAIRAKTGGSASIVADNFPTAIAAIPSCTIATASATPSTNSRSISFSNLAAQPKLWALIATSSPTITTNYYYGIAAVWDGGSLQGLALYSPNNASMTRADYQTNWSQSYSNGTLTVTMGSSGSRYFKMNTAYTLIYVY